MNFRHFFVKYCKNGLRSDATNGDSKKLSLIWIAICILGRLLPHPPNMTPLCSVCLFSGHKLPSWLSYCVSIISLFVSDAMLSYLYGYDMFGAWSFFTYSGFLFITFIGSFFMKGDLNIGRLFFYVVMASCIFWLWTNFGVWLSYTLYPKNLDGFISCYVAALPFLRNSIIGDVIFSAAIFYGFSLFRNKMVYLKNINSAV